MDDDPGADFAEHHLTKQRNGSAKFGCTDFGMAKITYFFNFMRVTYIKLCFASRNLFLCDVFHIFMNVFIEHGFRFSRISGLIKQLAMPGLFLKRHQSAKMKCGNPPKGRGIHPGSLHGLEHRLGQDNGFATPMPSAHRKEWPIPRIRLKSTPPEKASLCHLRLSDPLSQDGPRQKRTDYTLVRAEEKTLESAVAHIVEQFTRSCCTDFPCPAPGYPGSHTPERQQRG